MQKGTKEVAPFGNPDGSRADIEDVVQGFVTFGGSAQWGGLATPGEDFTARIFVGRKGSGKTVYLRRLQAYAKEQPDVYADDIQQSLPTTENIIKFCQLHEAHVLTEKWMLLWNRAILRSVASHILNTERINNNINPKRLETLLNYESIYRNFTTPVSIYSQVSEIIQRFDTRAQLTKFLQDPSWPEFEYRISELIKDCPPICFYIDAVDEEFAHAPMYWHQCQKGLFYQTMRFLRDAKLGGRLHIVICIRDIVLSSIDRSEHRTRYRWEPHIRILKWDKEAIRYFLSEKVKMLDDKYFIKKSLDKNLVSWLGTTKIHNEIRDCDEHIEDYLIRHTRLLPRDIVILGNSLCQLIDKNKDCYTESIEELLRDCVSNEAKIFGDEQLVICANHLASDQIPKSSALNGYSNIYTGNKEYLRGIAEDIKGIIKSIGKDRFTRSELEQARTHASSIFENKSDLFSILWQNGLIGYNKNNNSKLYEKIKFRSEDSTDFSIPLDKEIYVFHSCLIDSVGIEAIGLPVSY